LKTLHANTAKLRAIDKEPCKCMSYLQMAFIAVTMYVLLTIPFVAYIAVVGAIGG